MQRSPVDTPARSQQGHHCDDLEQLPRRAKTLSDLDDRFYYSVGASLRVQVPFRAVRARSAYDVRGAPVGSLPSFRGLMPDTWGFPDRARRSTSSISLTENGF
jgi:hypothetical protein